MPTTFWNLCSDVLIELCGYFSINELYSSFYPDVLPHLFELLKESHIYLHLCLNNNNVFTGTILSLINTNQIISLHTSTCNIPLNMFNSVKKITLKNVQNLDKTIRISSILPSLEHLIFIYSNHSNSQVHNALELAFSRPTLKYLKLHLNNDHSLIPNNPLKQSLSIEQLIINASCSPLTLNFLLKSLPRLRILRLRTLMNLPPEIEQNRPTHNNVIVPPFSLVHHPWLEVLDLIWYHPTITNITFLLTRLPNLKQCRLSGVMNSSELNGKIWHNLIEKQFLNLLRFNINMLVWTGIETENIKTEFDQDRFFQMIDFELIPSDNEDELLIFTGDFRRSI